MLVLASMLMLVLHWLTEPASLLPFALKKLIQNQLVMPECRFSGCLYFDIAKTSLLYDI